MNERPLTIFLSAAEPSGDHHAARLMAAIRRLRPDTRFVGVAGEQMAAQGCEVLADLTHRASMLLRGPILGLGHYLRLLSRLKRDIARIRPDLVVPVDSPAFNWHIAGAGKAAGSKVVYYIAPQVWAWAPWRVKKLARLTDHVACILPFEEAYLRQRGVAATYVGHPLFDDLPAPPQPPPDLLEAWLGGTWRVAMIAGSRPGEIKGHIRAMIATAEAIRRRWPKSHCIFAARTEACAAIIRRCGGRDVEIAVGQTRDILAHAHFALVKSGTVTLEAAGLGVPMVTFYRTSHLLRWLLAAVGKWAVPTKYFTLVNILAQRRLVPELTPWHGSARQLIDAVIPSMEDVGYLVEQRQALLDLTNPLRPLPGETASAKAAELVVAQATSR